MSVNDELVQKATALGHKMEWDPPGLSSATRWTCSACGRAALYAGGPLYGTALEIPCGPLSCRSLTEAQRRVVKKVLDG